jgi:Trk K+ transport system NAD-binding subunit
MCKHLNKRMKLIVRSTSPQNSEFLETIGVEHIENPFEVISNRLYLALTAPNLWLLEMWIYGHLLKIKEREVLPLGSYIIYGYGRMGRALEKGLGKAGVEYRFVDAKLSLREHDVSDSLYHEDEIEEKLIAAGIKKAAVVIAATRDDLINLAVIALAKKHNPSIYTISRENELIDLQIFKAARINRNYILDEIIINKTYNYLSMPLVNVFIEYLSRKDEAWGKRLVDRIVAKMGENPNLCEVRISEGEAFAAVHELQKERVITLDMLGRRRENYQLKNDLLFLMVLRDGHPILLPPDHFEIAAGDELLVICLEESHEDLKYILNNYYELHYVMHGKEKITGISRYFIA